MKSGVGEGRLYAVQIQQELEALDAECSVLHCLLAY